VIKLNVVALGRHGLDREIARLKPHGVVVLAEKVESQEDYRYRAPAGCGLS
jgi:c-di-GMP-related signal transduction protein